MEIMEVNRILNKCVGLFSYLNSKDVFINQYEKMLGKRLIKNETEDLTAQEQFLIVMKENGNFAYI